MARRTVIAAFEELLTVREKMLIPEEGEALEWLAESVRQRVEGQRIQTRIDDRHERGLAALDKLLRIERKERP